MPQLKFKATEDKPNHFDWKDGEVRDCNLYQYQQLSDHFPENFFPASPVQEKAEPKPTANKAEPGPAKNKSARKKKKGR